MPYSQEINDLPAIIERRQEAETFAGMIRSAVEQLLSECDRQPLVLGIALHPTTAGEIAEHVEANGLTI